MTKPVENTVVSAITTSGDNDVPTVVRAVRGSWEKPNATLRISYQWMHCAQEISSALSYAPNGCQLIGLKSVYLPGSCPIVNPLVDYELSEGTRFAGRHVALLEYVDEIATGSCDANVSGNRLATRVSVSTAYITESPKLWPSSAVYMAPSVPLKMRLGVSSTGVAGDWRPVYPNPTAGTVAWRGSPVGTVSTRWYRCDDRQTVIVTGESAEGPLPGGCDWISGATNAQYTPVADDLLAYIGMEVTAENSVGTSVMRTVSSRPVTDDVKNTVAPTLSGGRVSGETVTLDDGSWTGTPTPTISRKWFHCPTAQQQGASVVGCTEIAGASSSSLTLTPQMAGRFVVAQVIGENVAYGATDEKVTLAVTTSSTSQILEVPVSLSRPTLSGTANVGSSLSITDGTWRGTEAPTFGYRWIACDTAPSNVNFGDSLPADCAVVPGSLSSLLLSSVHSAKYVVGQHRAVNTAGTRYASTSVSAQVTEAPRNLTEVTISLERTAGETITANAGTWAGFPTPTYQYQWYTCTGRATVPSDTLANCTVAGSATSSRTFVLTSAHAGKYIRVEELATNTVNGSVGPNTQRKPSISSEPVRTPPAFAGNPTIAGTPHVGSVLTAGAGAITGFEAPELTYSWYACEASSTTPIAPPYTNCVVLQTGVSSNTYQVQSAASGKFVMVVVTATNPTGVASRSSATTAVRVSMTPELMQSPATAVDIVNQGKVVSVNTGQWRAFPTPTYSYQWFLCSAEVSGGGESVPATCTVIPGSTASTYTLASADGGKFVVARVTATIATTGVDRSTDSFSNSQGPVSSQPSYAGTSLATSGVHHVGEIVSLSTPVSGYPAPEEVLEWFHCASPVTVSFTVTPSGCSAIEGQQSRALTVPSEARGRYVVARVTARNLWTETPGNSRTVRSTTSSIRVSATPELVTPPALVVSTVAEGSTVSVSTGTWASFPTPPTYSYQWFACSSEKLETSESTSDDCIIIPTATGASYVLKAGDGGKYIVARVRASAAVNSPADGSTDSVTASTAEVLSSPSFVSGPVVTGNAHVGERLSATATISGYPTPSIGIQWYSCTSAVTTAFTAVPATCATIPGATEPQLLVPSSAAGKFVVAFYSLSNSWTSLPGKTASNRSSTSSTRVSQTPQNTVSPAHSGLNFAVGTVLTMTNGSWESFPSPPSFGYSWYRCDATQSSGANTVPNGCEVIPSATLNTYRLTAADVGRFVVGRVRASVSPVPAGVSPSTDAFTASRGVVTTVAPARLKVATVIRMPGLRGNGAK